MAPAPRRRASSRDTGVAWKGARSPGGYWHVSQRPLQSLVFLIPLILAYELGTRLYARDAVSGMIRDIYARSLLRDFLQALGATGYYLPGLIIVVVLLCWHVARRDPWTFDLPFSLLMWTESVVLALPLFGFAFLLLALGQPAARWTLVANAPPPVTWQADLVFAIGAGLYEELLFRLIAITVLHLFLVDVLAFPKRTGAIGAVLLSAVAFAIYHFPDLASFDLGRCLFYTLAGIYFAGVFVVRGFGIVVGAHAMYDVLVVLIATEQG